MSKSDVMIWQRRLRDAGVYAGKIDGDFGPGSRRASFELVNATEKPASKVRARGKAKLLMVNQNATRSKPITENLQQNLIESATKVFGPKAVIHVYSGGQDRKGVGRRRTGSIRHDDFGNGGRAADCYIYMNGKKLQGVELARLGQYWLAARLGGCGVEMATGGIHLDEWITPPKGGGLMWTYAYSNKKSWGAKVRQMLVDGTKGKFPRMAT